MGFPDFGGNKIFPGVTSHAFLFPTFAFTFLLNFKKIYRPVLEESPKNLDFGPILRVFSDFRGNKSENQKSGSVGAEILYQPTLMPNIIEFGPTVTEKIPD